MAIGIPIIFDAVSIYAHNECELASWHPLGQKSGSRMSRLTYGIFHYLLLKYISRIDRLIITSDLTHSLPHYFPVTFVSEKLSRGVWGPYKEIF